MTIAKEARRTLGLTQVQMAERLCVSQPTIARFERDDTELTERDRLAFTALVSEAQRNGEIAA